MYMRKWWSPRKPMFQRTAMVFTVLFLCTFWGGAPYDPGLRCTTPPPLWYCSCGIPISLLDSRYKVVSPLYTGVGPWTWTYTYVYVYAYNRGIYHSKNVTQWKPSETEQLKSQPHMENWCGNSQFFSFSAAESFRFPELSAMTKNKTTDKLKTNPPLWNPPCGEPELPLFISFVLSLA